MLSLYLVGGIVVILAIAIPLIIRAIKNWGKKEERYNNAIGDLEDVKKANKSRAKRANDSIDVVRKRMRTRIQN